MLCLNALWEISEGNVEDVRKVVAQSRPLAYTTVLTLLDRLARRGAVSRRKEGRGFRYQPTVERDKLRRLALKQFLEYHFDGSEAKLKLFLEHPATDGLRIPVEIAEAAAAGAERAPRPLAMAMAVPETVVSAGVVEIEDE
jgi:predicted transcriptional regulator